MSDEYTEISADWRHRDNLTWQIPSLLSAIAGGLVVAAYALELPSPEDADGSETRPRVLRRRKGGGPVVRGRTGPCSGHRR